MRNFKDVMKVSAVGAILLSALTACNSKPESNPTPPESDQVEVIIEQVVDGKVVDTRAVGRTDVVKYTGKTDGDDLVQLKWPGRVEKGREVKITAYAKPNLYLQEIKYRYSQSESRKSSPTSTNVRGDTYNASRPLTAVNENSPVLIPTEGAYDNRVYVSLEYESARKADYILTEEVTISGETAYDLANKYWGGYWNGWTDYGQDFNEEGIESPGDGTEYFEVTHNFTITSPTGKPLNVTLPVTLTLENELVALRTEEESDPETEELISETSTIRSLKNLDGVRCSYSLQFDSQGKAQITYGSIAKLYNLDDVSYNQYDRGWSVWVKGPYVGNPAPIIKSVQVQSVVFPSYKKSITYESGAGKSGSVNIYLR